MQLTASYIYILFPSPYFIPFSGFVVPRARELSRSPLLALAPARRSQRVRSLCQLQLDVFVFSSAYLLRHNHLCSTIYMVGSIASSMGSSFPR